MITKLTLSDLLEAGAHFGHQKARWNPKMRPFIFAERSGVHIINLEKTFKQLEKALEFAAELAKQGKTILFVGTKRQAQKGVREAAEACGMPYFIKRWPGGTFTNFGTLKKRIKKLKELEKQKASGELAKYTKKEQIVIEKDIAKMNAFIGGIKEMEKLPDAVLVFDIMTEKVAVREARAKNIPVIAVIDTNANPGLVDYPVVANDDAIKVVNLLATEFARVISENRIAPEAAAQPAPAPKETLPKKEKTPAKN